MKNNYWFIVAFSLSKKVKDMKHLILLSIAIEPEVGK